MSRPSVDPQKKPSLNAPRSVRCADRTLPLLHPQIMGVLNITPDSFADGGRYYRAGKLVVSEVQKVASDMCKSGASVLDIGGESTRPGAVAVV